MLDKTALETTAAEEEESTPVEAEAASESAEDTADTPETGDDGETSSSDSTEETAETAEAETEEPSSSDESDDGDEASEEVIPPNSLTVVEQQDTGPNVLMVVKSLDTSQSGTSAFNMASHLAASGGAVTVMSEGGRNLQTLLRRKVTHVEWSAPGEGPIGRMRASRRLTQSMESSGASVIHAFGRIVPGAVRSAADKRSGRMIVSVPGTYSLKGWGVRGRTEAMGRADHLIVPSDYVRLWLKDELYVPDDKISVIAPGIDLAHFNPAAVKAQRMIELARHHGIPEEDQVVLMPARLVEWKGQHSVVRAFEKLDRDNTTLI
ncbi:MAG: glycosyltransferase family 4 protein, partial [Pseudomonadota bacterium]